MQFEWDEYKAEENLKKHKISFEHAALVFCDPNRLEEYDYLHSDEEDRYIVIGKVNTVLFVVCTYRNENTIRIISARPATKGERRRYEWQLLK